MGQKDYSDISDKTKSSRDDFSLNPYAPEGQDLPSEIAIFPLTGALLLPCGQLPLNIFEPRYLAMINNALSTPHRMIGMIQPRAISDKDTKPPIYDIGCAGKIIDFHETPDGRYEITLSGISRFHVKEELEITTGGYRRVTPDWSKFSDDFEDHGCLGLNRDDLKSTLGSYFQSINMDCDWGAVDDAPDGRLITCLSMICPFEPGEKQALLETKCCKERAQLFMKMLKMASQSSPGSNEAKTQH